jgi:hypothetical protein
MTTPGTTAAGPIPREVHDDLVRHGAWLPIGAGRPPGHVGYIRCVSSRSVRSLAWPACAGRTVLPGASRRRAEDRHWMTVIINANALSPFWGTLSCALYPLVRELV